jgi:surfeit locus 1 family protein
VTAADGPSARRGLIIPSIVALVALAILLGLGFWQLERKAWKESLIATLTERLAGAPAALPRREAWAQLDSDSDEFRRVTFTAEFLQAQEALIYSAGSALRPDVSGVGYWVMTPARLPDGSTIMVNRGFVPEARKSTDTRREGQVAGPVEIIGVMRWPEARGAFTPADNPGGNLWFARDPAAIAATKGVGPVAPFYIEQEAPSPPGGLPKVGTLRINLPNNHLSYAVTWFGLALVLCGVFLVWAFRQPR